MATSIPHFWSSNGDRLLSNDPRAQYCKRPGKAGISFYIPPSSVSIASEMVTESDLYKLDIKFCFGVDRT